MSQPDWIVCEYPLPDPEMQDKWFDCVGIGGCVGQVFLITKEGRVVSGSGANRSQHHYNLNGALHFGRTLKSGEFFLYLAHFIDGQLQSVRRPDLIEFESSADSPEKYTLTFFCEHLGLNNGTLFRITASGRLLKIKNSVSEDTNFHGNLYFSPAMYGNYENKYVAHFNCGQLRSIEKIEDISGNC